MPKATFVLLTSQIRDRAIAIIRTAPIGYRVTVAEPRRNLEQNAAFWGLMDDISKSCEFGGESRSKEEWRTLFVSGWMRATGRRVEVVEGLEGEAVALGVSSRDLRKSEMSEVLDYANAWAANHEVERRVEVDA